MFPEKLLEQEVSKLATHKSALKRHQQSLKRKAKNAAVKSAIKTVTKKVRDNIKAGNIGEAKKALSSAAILLDRAVSKGVLHRNNASRKISRLSISVNSSSK